MGKDSYSELFASESLRGERIHWKINWFVYPVILLLSFMTFRFQGNRTGVPGMVLSAVNLLYNAFLGQVIRRNRSVRLFSYFTVTLNILSLTVYNYIDALNNSPLLTATSAALLLYPAIMFLASLRMDRVLVVYTTLLSCAAMNGLYFYFHRFFDLPFSEARLSADVLSQVYRNIYLFLIGYLIYSVPRSMLRVLGKQEELMREKSFHQTKAERDPLTSLFNRYYLNNHFEVCRERHRTMGYRYALFYIDLNDFKIINDTYGHDFGDFILKSVGEDLTRVIREDDVVARIGGDELVVLFQLKGEESHLEDLAKRVSEAILRPRTYQNITCGVQSSIGVALFPDHADSLAGLLKKADQAMYEIKRQRKHGVAFAGDMRERREE